MEKWGVKGEGEEQEVEQRCESECWSEKTGDNEEGS